MEIDINRDWQDLQPICSKRRCNTGKHRFNYKHKGNRVWLCDGHFREFTWFIRCDNLLSKEMLLADDLRELHLYPDMDESGRDNIICELKLALVLLDKFKEQVGFTGYYSDINDKELSGKEIYLIKKNLWELGYLDSYPVKEISIIDKMTFRKLWDEGK